MIKLDYIDQQTYIYIEVRGEDLFFMNIFTKTFQEKLKRNKTSKE